MATDNTVGSVGVAPHNSGSPSILAKVIYTETGGSNRINPDDVSDAVQWVTDFWDANSVHVRVAEMSFRLALTDTTDYPTLRGKLQVAVQEDNVLWFAGAGNEDGGEIVLPAGFSQVVAVGAINSSLQLSSFSSTGPEMELVAPGEGLRMSWHRNGDDSGANEFTKVDNGTSYSGPTAAAVARIALDKFPNWSASQLRSELQSHARDLGLLGKDNSYGYGMVDAYCIVAQHDPCVPLSVSISGNNNIQSMGYYTYEAFPTGGGSSSYAYKWKECSLSGTSCSAVGTSKTYSRWIQSSDPDFQLQVKVNDGDPDEANSSRLVFVNIGGGPESPPRRGGGTQ
jgi:hypothetical protein